MNPDDHSYTVLCILKIHHYLNIINSIYIPISIICIYNRKTDINQLSLNKYHVPHLFFCCYSARLIMYRREVIATDNIFSNKILRDFTNFYYELTRLYLIILCLQSDKIGIQKKLSISQRILEIESLIENWLITGMVAVRCCIDSQKIRERVAHNKSLAKTLRFPREEKSHFRRQLSIEFYYETCFSIINKRESSVLF